MPQSSESIVTVGAQKRRARSEAAGRFPGGITTRSSALAGATGNLMRLKRLPDPRICMAGVEFGGIIAENAFDSDRIGTGLDARGARIVVPQRARSWPPDREL